MLQVNKTYTNQSKTTRLYIEYRSSIESSVALIVDLRNAGKQGKTAYTAKIYLDGVFLAYKNFLGNIKHL